MSNDTEDAGQNDEQPASFHAQPWQVLIGIRSASDPANPSNMTEGLIIDMVASAEVMQDSAQGPRPDKTVEAVHFAQWFNQNKAHLVALWRTEYVQYMNLRRLSERGVPGLRVVGANEVPGLVGADGSKLQ